MIVLWAGGGSGAEAGTKLHTGYFPSNLVTSVLAELASCDLLIGDELGLVPFDRTGGEILFHLLADRYERRSTMVTTNLAFRRGR